MEPILEFFLNNCMSPEMADYIRSGIEVLNTKGDVDVSDVFIELAYQRDNEDTAILVNKMLHEMDACLKAALQMFGIHYEQSCDRHYLLQAVKLLINIDDVEYEESAVKILRKVYSQEQALEIFAEFMEHHTTRAAELWMDDIEYVQISTIRRLREIYSSILQRTEQRNDELMQLIDDGNKLGTIQHAIQNFANSPEWMKFVNMARSGYLDSVGVDAGESLTLIDTFAIKADYPTGLPFEANFKSLSRFVTRSSNLISSAVFLIYIAMISKEWNEKGYSLLDDAQLMEELSIDEDSTEMRLALFKAAVKTIGQHYQSYKERYEKA